jgi:Arc/MetJ family transcription regulator
MNRTNIDEELVAKVMRVYRLDSKRRVVATAFVRMVGTGDQE